MPPHARRKLCHPGGSAVSSCGGGGPTPLGFRVQCGDERGEGGMFKAIGCIPLPLAEPLSDIEVLNLTKDHFPLCYRATVDF